MQSHLYLRCVFLCVCVCVRACVRACVCVGNQFCFFLNDHVFFYLQNQKLSMKAIVYLYREIKTVLIEVKNQ